ncbi:extracellular solute-binding protein [Diplocloster hominis]|uniref:extracellular solute-binding protein n=1 Tax=Diplocloster hominis TaxID=3079010 RepID=UPI0031BA9FEA
MKRILTFGLALSICLAGCSAKNGTEPAPEAPKQTAAASQEEEGRYDSTLTVSMVRYVSSAMEAALAKTEKGETAEENRYNELFRDKLNIEIDYDWISSDSNYIEKVDMALAASNIPDFMAVTASQVKQLYEADLIWDMTDIYENYASEAARTNMEMEGDSTFRAVTYDGKLMAIPSTWSSYGSAQFLWIRQDWLKNLGLPEPTCMEDVVKIAYAFAQQDPDQNGSSDTTGLGVQQDLTASVGGLKGFFNGYGTYIGTWITDTEDRITYSDIQPDVQAVLGQLNKMYEDGVIARDFGTTNADGLISKLTAGSCGMFYGEHWMSLNLQACRDMDPEADWRPYPIVGLTPNSVPKNQIEVGTTYYWVASKQCANPEAIMKMMNLMWDLDAYYKSSEDAEEAWWFSPIWVQNPRINLEQWENVQKLLAGEEGNTEEQRWKQIEAYQDGDNSQWGIWMIYGDPDCSMSVLDAYLEKDMLLYSAFSGAPTKTMAANGAVLDSLRDTEFTRMITQGNISGTFESFVQNWNQMGGEQMTQEVTDRMRDQQ